MNYKEDWFMKYYVRTTLERKLDETYSQIEYELLIDKEHKPVDSFIKQLEIISEEDSVLLEDDLILCKNFKERIESVIEQFSDKIINFFTFPRAYFQTREFKKFLWNQCTYYPKNISKQIALVMKKIKKQKDEIGESLQYDALENLALEELGMTHIQYRPCIIQHLDGKSLIGNNDSGRMTIYFVDYLNELDITYEEAQKQENRLKLKYKILKTKKERGI